MRLWRWFRPLPEPPLVRLHVVHEGTDSGDMTVEGFLVADRQDYLVLTGASIIASDGRRTVLEGQTRVPRGRVVIVQRMASISSPLLDMELLS